ncbi:hypothetical protein [Dactylosporangium sp. NPDC051484]|uniref:hypothetical protein n=1 Tax=Dactylosporangium sp. NPDC051484 TaxID=3154942 RepID=UPI00344D732F
MKIEHVVCDVCHDMPVKTYRVTHAGRVRSTDLCEEHGKPFAELFNDGYEEARPPRAARTRGGPRVPRVTTMEEIEKLKQDRRKP